MALSEEEDTPMNNLTLKQLQNVDKRFGKDVLEVFDYQRSVEMKSAVGGTSREAVMEQIRLLKESVVEA